MTTTQTLMTPATPQTDAPASVAAAGGSVVALDCALLLGPDGPLPMTGVTHLRFADLDAALLARAAPAMIVLPLIATHCDATTAVVRLEALGYSGKLCVLAPKLPKPALVEGELRRLGPGKRLTLISPD